MCACTSVAFKKIAISWDEAMFIDRDKKIKTRLRGEHL